MSRIYGQRYRTGFEAVIGWESEGGSWGLREGDGGEGVTVTENHRGGMLAVEEIGGVDVGVGTGWVETV